MAASSTSVITNDGPVLTLINKRLRALRKKLNRIYQMEESLSKGKTLNKEQEETLRSKPAIVAGIDELEKLRMPLSEALNQEIQIVLEKNKQMPEAHPEDRVDGEENAKRDGDDETASALSDLLSLVYFGSIFDVQTLLMAQENALMRTHERNCCLTYDYVTDDDAAGDPLKDWDLDLIAMMGSLVISRPIDSCLSHKNALQKCVEHAKLWLANSEQPIEPNSNVTCKFPVSYRHHFLLGMSMFFKPCLIQLNIERKKKHQISVTMTTMMIKLALFKNFFRSYLFYRQIT